MPIVDCAPFFLAQKKGFFADEGLKVEPVMIQGGAEGVPKLKSGALDVSFGNYVSFIQAQASGMKIHIMAEGYQATDGLLAVMAPPSSGIEGPEDLAGKTIAVNTLNNVGTLTVKSVLRTYGVDLNSVHFVAVPFPRMIQALRDGDADAAWMVEPFISAAKQALGAYMVLDSASGATEGLPVGGYVTTQRFVKEHPRTAAAFHRAIVRGERLAASRSQVEKILPDYTKMDRETVALVGIGRYPTSVDQTRLQRVADLMKEFGILKKRLDVGTMIS